MNKPNRLLIVFAWLSITIFVSLSGSSAQTKSAQPQKSRVPKLWDARELATWATPIAGVNATPDYYTEEEYYAAPVDNLRTYPVYHPDYEPKGYWEWLKKQGAQPLIEPDKLKTERDWIEAGSRVFDELDVPLVRTANPQALKFLRDREALKRQGVVVAKDGAMPTFRWVVMKNGEIKLGLSECAACHTRVMEDGSIIRGAQGNPNFANEALGALLEGFAVFNKKLGITVPHAAALHKQHAHTC